jgi:hypothetical protein
MTDLPGTRRAGRNFAPKVGRDTQDVRTVLLCLVDGDRLARVEEGPAPRRKAVGVARSRVVRTAVAFGCHLEARGWTVPCWLHARTRQDN